MGDGSSIFADIIAFITMLTGLESARLKLIRAKKHLETLQGIIATIDARTDLYEVIKDANGKETFNLLEDLPPDIAIIAGEIIYQLRSALDHLAFNLVQFNPSSIALPAKWDKRCDFPLWFTIPDEWIKKGHVNPPLPYNCFEKTLPGISKDAFAFIESCQPYYIGPGIHNTMRVITQLSNIDKHRHLNVIVPNVSVRHFIGLASGDRIATITGGFKQGAEITSEAIGDVDGTVEMQRSFSSYITFDEPTVGQYPATMKVEEILERCLENLELFAIPAFTQFLK